MLVKVATRKFVFEPFISFNIYKSFTNAKYMARNSVWCYSLVFNFVIILNTSSHLAFDSGFVAEFFLSDGLIVAEIELVFCIDGL